MIFFAYEFLARDRAGLQLSGVEDGKLQWMGTHTQWGNVEKNEFDLIWR